jgi:hypothetical protein
MTNSCCLNAGIANSNVFSIKTMNPDLEPPSRFDRGSNDPLKVNFAQRTFDAEGGEASGRFFSRVISWPRLGNSGVTIGRGYDMGQRTPSQIIRELSLAGMPPEDAHFLSRAAFKRGADAGEFVQNFKSSAPVMSLEVQRNLFDKVTTPEMINDIKRIFNKQDVVSTYGKTSWDELSPAAQELVFDLRYRGDYSPATRKAIQSFLVNKDYEGLRSVINDTAYWQTRGVPAARIRERQAMAREL